MRAFRYVPILPILGLEDERLSLPTLCADLILINVDRFTTMASSAWNPWLPLQPLMKMCDSSRRS